ncbi:hypothetical protein [Jatrophihabitans endophyticus]|uniref:hypothetical protein n=1 Tax=Jatrophihabitans endophyticus TaxID=1206085 RepID=UPI001A09A8B0|nr:hypothetical protein [Jatrophihabitans endophyticus]MBE7187178.1 hypothetical protein [Jatrophihabitans endophyticus]
MNADTWSDLLYRPRTGPTPGCERHRFGPLEAVVVVIDTEPVSSNEVWCTERLEPVAAHRGS